MRRFRPSFANMSHACRAMVARHSYENRDTFMVSVSHEALKMALSFIFTRTTVVAVSHDTRTNSLSCSHVFLRLSRDCRTIFTSVSVANLSNCKLAKISRRQVRDTRTNVVRLSAPLNPTFIQQNRGMQGYTYFFLFLL